jgi:hypothetical protein
MYVASILQVRRIEKGIRDEILDQFVCWIHGFLKECNNDVVELLLE